MTTDSPYYAAEDTTHGCVMLRRLSPTLPGIDNPIANVAGREMAERIATLLNADVARSEFP